MRAVVQRVIRAGVSVKNAVVGSIGKGFLVFWGVEKGDTAEDVEYLCHKISGLRIFEDETGKMNLPLSAVNGSILLISQFTLMADMRHGFRPSFSAAADSAEGKLLYEKAIETFRRNGFHVETGIFGADMAVELCNDGPVTLLLSSRKEF